MGKVTDIMEPILNKAIENAKQIHAPPDFKTPYHITQIDESGKMEVRTEKN